MASEGRPKCTAHAALPKSSATPGSQVGWFKRSLTQQKQAAGWTKAATALTAASWHVLAAASDHHLPTLPANPFSLLQAHPLPARQHSPTQPLTAAAWPGSR